MGWQHPILNLHQQADYGEYLNHWKTTYGLPHATDKTVVSCHQLVALTTRQLAVQERMLAAADPGNKTAEIEEAAARAEASLARIQKLEQELKAARALNADAGGDRLLELLTELLAANREMEARLASIDAKTCGCVVS